MKAQWRRGTAQGTVNTAGLQAQQPPRVGTASTRVVGRVWGKGRAWLQGSKRGRGNSQPSVALWAEIMESSGVKRMNTERDLKTQQTQSWLDSFIPYLKLIRLARNSNSLYIELQGWKKIKGHPVECFSNGGFISLVCKINLVSGDFYSKNEIK